MQDDLGRDQYEQYLRLKARYEAETANCDPQFTQPQPVVKPKPQAPLDAWNLSLEEVQAYLTLVLGVLKKADGV